MELNLYDKCEVIEGCTVEILTNTLTGETSVGWWRGGVEDRPEMEGIAHPNAYHLTNYATLILREAPTIDVAPVKHGQWVQVICHEEFEDGFVDRVKECCSICHAPNWQRTTNYCPSCGAKMQE